MSKEQTEALEEVVQEPSEINATEVVAEDKLQDPIIDESVTDGHEVVISDPIQMANIVAGMMSQGSIDPDLVISCIINSINTMVIKGDDVAINMHEGFLMLSRQDQTGEA